LDAVSRIIVWWLALVPVLSLGCTMASGGELARQRAAREYDCPACNRYSEACVKESDDRADRDDG